MDYMLQRKEWEDLRAEIENIIKEHDISSADFKALDIHEEWHQIEENIYRTFCQLNHPTVRPIWLWEHFKLETSSLVVLPPFAILEQLIDPSEEVWFFVNGDKDKFWFYQGTVKAIRKVILESCYIDELYLASKKYDWLICINHHDALIATGKVMAEKLKNLSDIEP
jgi:hypothetical protein